MSYSSIDTSEFMCVCVLVLYRFENRKNTVMNISPLEAKVREVTSNDPWGASSQDKQIVADHTHSLYVHLPVLL